MRRRELRRVDTAALPYLLAVPAGAEDRPLPVLCFLHGYDEGAPAPIDRALTRHGPLRDGAAAAAREFIVVAPQLPIRGDLWHRHASAVERIVREASDRHGGDPGRTYLTGFSFGGNGVFDLALEQDGVWTALWAVDPTRVPVRDLGRPVWLSFGEVARRGKEAFLRRLRLREASEDPAGDRLYADRGEDHVGSATSAYAEERVYRWLLSRRSAAEDGGDARDRYT